MQDSLKTVAGYISKSSVCFYIMSYVNSKLLVYGLYEKVTSARSRHVGRSMDFGSNVYTFSAKS